MSTNGTSSASPHRSDDGRPVDIGAIFRDGTALDGALLDAAREAMKLYRAYNQQVPVWRDGRVQYISVDEAEAALYANEPQTPATAT